VELNFLKLLAVPLKEKSQNSKVQETDLKVIEGKQKDRLKKVLKVKNLIKEKISKKISLNKNVSFL
jgi:flagellar motility protein MotE (MotC chaperone)